MNPRHVLYLIDELWGLAGAERTLLHATRLLPKDRYRCSVVTFRANPDAALLRQFPCPVYEFPIRRTLSLASLESACRLRRLIRGEHVAVVHTFFETADLWGGLVARLSGSPVLVSSRRDMGILRSSKHHLAYRLVNPLFDQVQAVSDEVGRFALSEGGLDPARLVTVANGVDLETLDAAEAGAGLRQSLGVPADAYLIASVGNVRPVKGFDVAIRAMAQVCRECPRAVLLIFGHAGPSDYYRELQELVRQLGLAANVRFPGYSHSVYSTLKACQGFCLLSRSEGMSNALLEAMACGLPVVATSVGGTPQVIEDGYNGYLVAPGSPEAAAGRLLELIAHPDWARRLGAAARDTIEDRFSVRHMVDSMVRMYDRLLGARDAVPRASLAANRLRI